VARAEAILTIARRLYGGGNIAGDDELGAYGLLYSGASVEELRTFSRDALAALRAYDEKHQTELERTLRFYFESGENVKTTAASLNVHRHTVFYRLRQIAEISGKTLENPHDQLTLRLAIAIDALNT
ncbi:MAG TPA: helix-turn-helix domain-containing protein, partial [Candidatus Baltobacteraceae bacterium]|nr:helix-turn-helix domain-containing protein [Candidatus Baltobacteraceae bacterium]